MALDEGDGADGDLGRRQAASRQIVPDRVLERRLVQMAVGDDIDDDASLGLADLELGDGLRASSTA